ncbi:MAG TPA: TIM barrel protein [Puia sp.]|jgi:sugar phosphate isomerase/epimerase|nr:TIM barrel protein [Puia sp.]
MQKLSRRKFIGRTAKGLGAAWTLANLPAQLRATPYYIDIPLGFQTFPIRDRLSKDFTGTLKTMAGFGYKLVEMCAPKDYQQIGFGSLVDKKPAELKSMIIDSGLTCPSCHFGWTGLKESLDDRIEFAQGLGLSQMICSTFWLPDTSTLDDYKKNAEQLNKIAEKIKAAGMVTGFHNHSMEFHELGGQLIYDALMAAFDPALVKMQFQTEVITLGYKASTYFTKYPGRFISSHLSDWSSDKKYVPIGQGMIDWKEFFRTAKTGGVKNYFVEMNFETFEPSAAYIHGLKI